MRERVQSSIEKLGYVPSIAAQRMSGSRSYLILALNDRERTIEAWNAREGSDWVDQMLLGGMLKCAEYGYRLIFELVDTRDNNIQRELKAAIAALQPDGVILTPPHSGNRLITELLEAVELPYVLIGSYADGESISITMGDDSQGHTLSDCQRTSPNRLYRRPGGICRERVAQAGLAGNDADGGAGDQRAMQKRRLFLCRG